MDIDKTVVLEDLQARKAVLEVPYAGFWSRVGAKLIDLFILGGLIVLTTGAGLIVGGIMAVLNIGGGWLIYLLYPTLMEGSPRQATFGKMASGIKVTDLAGGKLTFFRSFLRNISKVVSQSVCGIGFFMAAFTEKKQALHDLMTGCLVVRYRKSYFWRVLLVILVIQGGLVFGAVSLIRSRYPTTESLLSALIETQWGSYLKRFQTEPEATVQVKPPEFVSAKEVISLSADQYGTVLQSNSVKFEKGYTLSTGPVAVLLEEGLPKSKSVNLRVRVLPVPNLELVGPGAVEVRISQVIDRRKKNIFDHNNSFESQFMRAVNLQKLPDPSRIMEGERPVHLIKDAKVRDLNKVVGDVVLHLPVGLEVVTLQPKESGAEVVVSDPRVTLESMSGNEALLIILGEVKNIVDIWGYAKDGQLLVTSSVPQDQSQAAGKLKVMFSGEVAALKVVIATGFVEKAYPFAVGPAVKKLPPKKPAAKNAPVKKTPAKKTAPKKK